MAKLTFRDTQNRQGGIHIANKEQSTQVAEDVVDVLESAPHE